jgi:hypothetical protein
MIKILRAKLPVSLALLVLFSFTSCKQAELKPIKRNLPIKAAIIYSLGGAQPVARENFYLLDKDAIQIWKEAGLVKDEKMLWLEFSIDRLYADEKKSSKFGQAINPHIVNTTTTDFEGNAMFENVPEGSYYIYGVTETRGGIAVWSYKISTNENKAVLLDNKNAVYAR